MNTHSGYRLGASCVAVETDDPDAARWLAEFAAPWFESCDVPPSALRIRFITSRAAFDAIAASHALATTRPFPCFRLDREVVMLAGWTDAATTTVADPELRSFYRTRAGGVDVVARPGFARARIGLMRVVRELLVRGAQTTRPRLDLHAAAFATAAGAVLLVGPKQAGKTTLLAHCIRGERASLIANDRVLVDTEPAQPVASGVPTLVSVRAGTLAWFPELRRTRDERPSLLHAGERPQAAAMESFAASPPREFALTPAQFATRCESGVIPNAPIAAIVFPEIDPDAGNISLEAISVVGASMRLLASRYGVRGSPEQRTIFDDLTGVGEPGDGSAVAQVARLAAAAPLFACRLGREAYAGSADQLLRELVGERIGAELPR